MTKTKVLTSHDIQQQIDQVQADRERLEGEKTHLLAQIAEAWGKEDTIELESAVAAKNTKIEAAAHTLIHLRERHAEVLRTDFLLDYQEAAKRWQPMVQQQNDLAQKRDQLQEELAAVENELRIASMQVGDLQNSLSRSGHHPAKLQDLGITWADLDAIRSKYKLPF